MSQEQRRKKAASLKRMSVAEGFAMERVWEGERCFSIGVQERGMTMKKFYSYHLISNETRMGIGDEARAGSPSRRRSRIPKAGRIPLCSSGHPVAEGKDSDLPSASPANSPNASHSPKQPPSS